MRKIRFGFGSVVLEAELLPTPTAEAIWRALPMRRLATSYASEMSQPELKP